MEFNKECEACKRMNLSDSNYCEFCGMKLVFFEEENETT